MSFLKQSGLRRTQVFKKFCGVLKFDFSVVSDAANPLRFYVTDDDLRQLKDLRCNAHLYTDGEFLLNEAQLSGNSCRLSAGGALNEILLKYPCMLR